jgi:hypothetical protein
LPDRHPIGAIRTKRPRPDFERLAIERLDLEMGMRYGESDFRGGICKTFEIPFSLNAIDIRCGFVLFGDVAAI